MKKSFLFMSLLLGLFVSVFALTACSSDDDDKDTPEAFIGTMWTYTASDGFYCELTLKSESVAHIIIKSSSGILLEDADYNYTYDEATHTGRATYLSGTAYYGSDASATFIVNGNKLTYTNSGGEVFTLTKRK